MDDIMDLERNKSFAIACQSEDTSVESTGGSGIILFLGIAVGIGGEPLLQGLIMYFALYH